MVLCIFLSLTWLTWEYSGFFFFLRQVIPYKAYYAIFSITGVNTAIKSVILNTLLLVPFYNLGMSICKYYDFQEEKALCSSSANVPTTAPCEECEYLGLSKAHQRDSNGQLLSTCEQSTCNIVNL